MVADNVLKPGAPLFLWRVAKSGSHAYQTKIVQMTEFAMPAEDWMSVSIVSGTVSSSSKVCLEPPAELYRLSEDADGIRHRAFQKGGRLYRRFSDWPA